MGAFFIYILKSSVCLTAFYLLYKILLSEDTFHKTNRFTLLGILALSFVIPLLKINIESMSPVQNTVLDWERLLQMAQQSDAPISDSTMGINWLAVLLIVYFAGIIFFICRSLYSFSRMILLLYHSKKEILEKGIRLIIHNRDISPFSWMQYIVISEQDLNENGNEILTHEKAHIHRRHSLDLLLAEVVTIVQWFNPSAWLMKKEIQGIHEFEADEAVIKSGIDAKKYQLLLIKKAVGSERFNSMTNSFNHSKLKKRITMMLKEKSNSWAKLKYVYLLPLTAMSVLAFANPQISEKLEKASDNLKVTELSSKSDKKNPLIAMQTGKGTNKKSSEKKEKKDPKVVVYTNNVVINPGDGGDNNTDLQAIGTGPDAKDIKVTIVNKSTGKPSDLHVKEIPTDKKMKPLYVLDGVVQTEGDFLQSLDPKDIEKIEVLKDASATHIYGEKGKNGVIIITKKKAE